MWVYRSNIFDERPAVIYEYQKTRKADHPEEFLEGFKGILVTDGYDAYHKLARKKVGEIKIAGCWVHHKRMYANAVKAMGKAGANTAAGTLADQAIKKIQEIFHKDNELNTLDAESRQKKRKDEITPLVDDFFAWVKKTQERSTQEIPDRQGFYLQYRAGRIS